MPAVKSTWLILLSTYLLVLSGAGHAQHAEIVVDASSGIVLHEENANQLWFPASLTKLMTIYMAFDAIREGQLHFNDNLVTSAHAAHQPTSKLGLRQGETLTVKTAILALITRSANDAAVVLAEKLGGTEANFAEQMTAKAQRIGMHSTHFMNATGLPNEQQITTASDMALLAWHTRKDFSAYYPYFSAHQMTFRGRELRAINKFTNTYPGAEGMKTGFTCGSGYNLISSATQHGKHLIGVVLGGMTSAQRYQLMIRQMNAGFANSDDSQSLKNISTMPSESVGVPGYQLGCGHGAPITMTSNEHDNSYRANPDVRSAPITRRHLGHKVSNRKSAHKPALIKKSAKSVSRNHKETKPATRYKKAESKHVARTRARHHSR